MSQCVTMCHMLHVRCILSYFYLCSYLGEGGRPPGGLEVLVMGSDVRDLVLGRRNIMMENISNRWKFVSSFESLSSHANWETEEIQCII